MELLPKHQAGKKIQYIPDQESTKVVKPKPVELKSTATEKFVKGIPMISEHQDLSLREKAKQIFTEDLRKNFKWTEKQNDNLIANNYKDELKEKAIVKETENQMGPVYTHYKKSWPAFSKKLGTVGDAANYTTVGAVASVPLTGGASTPVAMPVAGISRTAGTLLDGLRLGGDFFFDNQNGLKNSSVNVLANYALPGAHAGFRDYFSSIYAKNATRKYVLKGLEQEVVKKTADEASE